MTKLLNLDAMIRREDLSVVESDLQEGAGEGGVPVTELRKGRLHYNLLRKPDFQRETNDWDIDNVVTFIKSLRDGHLIPSLILWRSQNGFHFVIDGAHRLSALIAWVNDDYGDRAISQEFFNHKIPSLQKRNADECRKKIASEVGTFNDLSSIDADHVERQKLIWGQNIARSLTAQWVPGNAGMAETSFLTINQRAVQIKDAEKAMILGRKTPKVIAARAVVRNATGNKYWMGFPQHTQERIEARAKQIYDLIFEPEDADLARTIEAPIAGAPYSANSLRMAHAVVRFSNSHTEKFDKEDLTGDATAECLDNLYNVFRHITGEAPSSLGLHPSVYFYGDTGNHSASSVLASINFFRELTEQKKLYEFCEVRARFEEFVVTRGEITKHIFGKLGGWEKVSLEF